MSEEIEHASVVVPRAMVTSIILNGALGFGFLIAVLFSMGDMYAALGTKTGYPIIEIFYQATNSKMAVNLMISGIIFSAITSTWGNLAAASRIIWAFCRDNGLPYSSYFSHVRQISPLSLCLVFVYHEKLDLSNIVANLANRSTLAKLFLFAPSFSLLFSSSSLVLSTSQARPLSTPSLALPPSRSTLRTFYPSFSSSCAAFLANPFPSVHGNWAPWAFQSTFSLFSTRCS